MQLKELDSAVERASEEPARYNLTNEELSTRRRWIEMTRRQIEALQEGIKKASAAPPPPRGAGFYDDSLSEERVREANNRFVGSELERQALITRQQDHQLDEIEMGVLRIGQMGRTIGEELESQQRILNALDDELDTTQTRLKATIKKINEIIRKSGGCSQLCVILVLLGVVIFLGYFLFS
jgi:SYP6 family syntaxin